MERPEDGIIEIHLNHLSKNQHIFAMEFVLDALEKYQIVAQDFPEAHRTLARAFEREKEAFQCHVPFDLIDEKKEYGKERDRAFRFLNLNVNALLLNSDKEIVEAAEKIHRLIKNAGGARIINKSVTTKTAIFNSLVYRSRTDFQAEIELLDSVCKSELTTALNELEKANAAFSDTREGLVKDRSEHVRRELSKARLMTDRAYRALIDSVNIRTYLDQTDAYDPFIAYMNTELSQLRSLLRQKKTKDDEKDQSDKD